MNTPLVKALGLNPRFWAHFTINSKHVMHMEMARRVGFVPTLSRGLGRDPAQAATEFVKSLGVQGARITDKD
jgi:hypothetical protein